MTTLAPPTVRLLVTEVLAAMGYHTIEAPDGAAALKPVARSEQRSQTGGRLPSLREGRRQAPPKRKTGGPFPDRPLL